MAKKPDNIKQYQKDYSESDFWDKLKDSASKAVEVWI